MAISIPELTAMRRDNNAQMPTLCTLSRGGTLVSPQPTMPDGTPLRGRWGVKGTLTLPGLGSLDQQPKWRIALPDGLATPPPTILVGDVLTRDSGTFGVLEIDDPESYSAATTVYALQLTDAAGNPVYLRPNATVNVTRQDGTPATNGIGRRVRILNPAESVERVLASGGQISRWLIDVPDTDYGINYVVRVTQLDGFASPPDITTFSVSSIDPASSSGVSWLEIGLAGSLRSGG